MVNTWRIGESGRIIGNSREKIKLRKIKRGGGIQMSLGEHSKNNGLFRGFKMRRDYV